MSLRVLIAHNAYQQRGGEDSVVQSENDLLVSRGHAVQWLSRHNDDIAGRGKAGLAVQTVWSTQAASDMASAILAFRPDVIHVHNTFPLLSPSIYWAAAKLQVPVVQTLHNFRLHCPQAMYLRNGQVCEDCQGRLPWRAVLRSCYRDSRAQSAVLATMLTVHRAMGTWQHKVTRYIALNDFCRQKFIDGGLPAERLVVKPNFVDGGAVETHPRSGYLFVGRLSAEKGVATLAEAARLMPMLGFSVAGSGPELPRLQGMPYVSLLGALGPEDVRHRMLRAQALVLPSIWFENFPRTIVEAFAAGLPVIASRIGALAELIEHGTTGLLFEPGNAADLAKQLAWAEANPGAMSNMGKQARVRYEQQFSPDSNYRQLIQIYEDSLAAQQEEQS